MLKGWNLKKKKGQSIEGILILKTLKEICERYNYDIKSEYEIF